MRAGVEAHGADHPFACGWQAGCLAVETMHLPGQTFCCGRKRADHRKHSVGEPVARSAQIRGGVRVHQESLIH